MNESWEIVIKLVMALAFGGIMGIDRERRRMPAGFRTYMLVCLGSALVMMTNEYICERYGTGDVARMGAQVISGIGFLGAGTIIVTRNNRVHGLTTAAGLWAVACIGLAIGVGFYLAAIVGEVLIIVDMVFVQMIQDHTWSAKRRLELYVEFDTIEQVERLFEFVKGKKIKVINFELAERLPGGKQKVPTQISLELPKKVDQDKLLMELHTMEGVLLIQEY